jgi:hypothetical protein
MNDLEKRTTDLSRKSPPVIPYVAPRPITLNDTRLYRKTMSWLHDTWFVIRCDIRNAFEEEVTTRG